MSLPPGKVRVERGASPPRQVAGPDSRKSGPAWVQLYNCTPFRDGPMLRDSNISTDVHRLETSSRRQHRTSTLQNGSKLGHTHSMDAFTLKFRSFSIFNDVILYHRPIKALVV